MYHLQPPNLSSEKKRCIRKKKQQSKGHRENCFFKHTSQKVVYIKRRYRIWTSESQNLSVLHFETYLWAWMSLAVVCLSVWCCLNWASWKKILLSPGEFIQFLSLAHHITTITLHLAHEDMPESLLPHLTAAQTGWEAVQRPWSRCAWAQNYCLFVFFCPT